MYSHYVGFGDGKVYTVHITIYDEVERFLIDPRLKIDNSITNKNIKINIKWDINYLFKITNISRTL